jgi:hypothetical protein
MTIMTEQEIIKSLVERVAKLENELATLRATASLRDEIFKALSARERNNELEAVLTKLAALKHYKDLHGKDHVYELAMPQAWKEANGLLTKLMEERL